MKILAIDTSGTGASAAIVDDYITIGEFSVHTQKKMTHSEILMPIIDALFQQSGLQVHDMDFIACVSGPGSFTGLRIGAATARGLADACGKPLLAVPTLDALAYNVGYGTAPGTWVVPMMDARRAQVYTAFYRSYGTEPDRVSPYMAAPVTDILSQLAAFQSQPGGRVVFLGDGADAYAEEILKTIEGTAFDRALVPPPHNRQRAALAGYCALRLAREQTPTDFELLYVRKPQAERVRLGEPS